MLPTRWSEAALVFGMQPGSYHDHSIMEFLLELHRHLDDDKVTLIWDGLPSHRSRAMQAFVKSQRHWLVVERLPPYAYDLNPVEQVWGNLRGPNSPTTAPTPSETPPRSLTRGSVGSATKPSSPLPSSVTATSGLIAGGRGITQRLPVTALGPFAAPKVQLCRHASWSSSGPPARLRRGTGTTTGTSCDGTAGPSSSTQARAPSASWCWPAAPRGRSPTSASPTSTVTIAWVCPGSCSGSHWTECHILFAVLFPASGFEYFERLRHASVFHDQIDVRPVPVERNGPAQTDAMLTLSAVRLDHHPETFGWRIEEPDGRHLLADRLEAAGIRGPDVGRLQRTGWIETAGGRFTLDELSVGRPGQSVAFVMDTGWCDAAVTLAEGVDLMVCESTFADEEMALARKWKHLTASDAARAVSRCWRPTARPHPLLPALPGHPKAGGPGRRHLSGCAGRSGPPPGPRSPAAASAGCGRVGGSRDLILLDPGGRADRTRPGARRADSGGGQSPGPRWQDDPCRHHRPAVDPGGRCRSGPAGTGGRRRGGDRARSGRGTDRVPRT